MRSKTKKLPEEEGVVGPEGVVVAVRSNVVALEWELCTHAATGEGGSQGGVVCESGTCGCSPLRHTLSCHQRTAKEKSVRYRLSWLASG